MSATGRPGGALCPSCGLAAGDCHHDVAERLRAAVRASTPAPNRGLLVAALEEITELRRELEHATLLLGAYAGELFEDVPE